MEECGAIGHGVVLGASDVDLASGLPALEVNQAPAGPARASLKRWVSDIDGYTCDVCKQEFLSGSVLYQCTDTEYDECEQCYLKKQQEFAAAEPEVEKAQAQAETLHQVAAVALDPPAVAENRVPTATQSEEPQPAATATAQDPPDAATEQQLVADAAQPEQPPQPPADAEPQAAEPAHEQPAPQEGATAAQPAAEAAEPAQQEPLQREQPTPAQPAAEQEPSATTQQAACDANAAAPPTSVEPEEAAPEAAAAAPEASDAAALPAAQEPEAASEAPLAAAPAVEAASSQDIAAESLVAAEPEARAAPMEQPQVAAPAAQPEAPQVELAPPSAEPAAEVAVEGPPATPVLAQPLETSAETPAMPTAPTMPVAPSTPLGAEEFEQAQDFSSEPLDSRIESKDLNRRCSAYAEVRSRMEAGATDQEAFDIFWRHHNVCLGETLPKGQDAALSALAVYLQQCPSAQAEGLLPLVRRLLEHKAIDKPKMQQLVPPVILALAEICECAPIMKEVTDCLTDIEGAKKKVQGFVKKQTAFIIKVVSTLLSEFGAAKMNPKLGFLGIALRYVSDSDRAVKESCFGVFMELSAWVGDISEFIKPMEEPQKKELAKRLDAVPEEKKGRGRPQRVYRSEAAQAADGSVEDEGAAAAAVDFDAHDLAEAVDALKKLPKGWCIEKIFSMEKWKEKQDHLHQLAAVLDTTSIAPCKGYDDLVPALKRMMKSESNIPVVTEAAKCIGLMAKGLRGHFERPARQLFPVMLARMNDKSVWKPNVLIERVEQLVWAVPFEVVLEDLQPHIASKSAFAKKESMNLLLRLLSLPQVLKACPDALQRFLAPIANAVVPNVDDSDSAVRREAARCLATLAAAGPDAPGSDLSSLDKVPSSRRGLFQEEWAKIAKDKPCPLSAASSPGRPTSRAPSRAASARPTRAASAGGEAGGRSRPASPVPGAKVGSRPQSRPASRPVSRPASPGRFESPARVVRPPSVERHAAEGESAEVMKEMAEEIKSLRSAVARLEAQQGGGTAPARRSTARLRPASPGGPELRPTTPRAGACTPTRQTRRLSVGSGCGSPAPAASTRFAGSSGTLPRQNSATQFENYCEFEVELPRQTKQARQQRERNQYWGPGPIPAEYLAALRDAWKYCVEDHLCKSMFSEKLERQLFALQSWRSHLLSGVDSVAEVLDMLLKWLTWLLFNSNTQIWKKSLDVLGSLLDGVVASEHPLTERETQILVPNLLERSGHNIAAIREVMQGILSKLRGACPRAALLPMLLQGVGSKNKRSVACVLKCLGDSLDRQAAASIWRSQRDVSVILRMLEEKDADIRRGAVHVVASLSLHLDGDTFARLCKGLSPAVMQVVRGAAQRLAPPTPGGSPCGATTPRPLLTPRAADERSAPLQQQAVVTPRATSASRRASPQARTCSPSRRCLDQSAGGAAPSSSPAAARVEEQVFQLTHGNQEQFRDACEALKERVKQQVTEHDASVLAEGLVTALRFYLGHTEPTSLQDRCRPIVDVLDGFCALKEWVRPLSTEALRRLLREHLRHLNNSAWTKFVQDGSSVLRTLNLSCVMLLSAMRRETSYSLLLELATEESEVISSSLVLKCLRKLNKGLATSRQPDVEVTGVLEVLRAWLQRANARLAQGTSEGSRGMVDAAVSALMEGAREVVASAQSASPQAVQSWLRQAWGPEAQTLQEWLSATDNGKENKPNSAAAAEPAQAKERRPSLQRRRASSPAKMSGSPSPARPAPCGVRNSVQ